MKLLLRVLRNLCDSQKMFYLEARSAKKISVQALKAKDPIEGNVLHTEFEIASLLTDGNLAKI